MQYAKWLVQMGPQTELQPEWGWTGRIHGILVGARLFGISSGFDSSPSPLVLSGLCLFRVLAEMA